MMRRSQGEPEESKLVVIFGCPVFVFVGSECFSVCALSALLVVVVIVAVIPNRRSSALSERKVESDAHEQKVGVAIIV